MFVCMSVCTRLPARTVRRLAVECDVDPRTVVAAIEGRSLPVTRRAVRDAATRLGIELPAAPEAKP